MSRQRYVPVRYPVPPDSAASETRSPQGSEILAPRHREENLSRILPRFLNGVRKEEEEAASPSPSHPQILASSRQSSSQTASSCAALEALQSARYSEHSIDMGHRADSPTREASPQAPPVTKDVARLHLESPQTWVTVSSPNDLGHHHPLHQQSSHAVVATDADGRVAATPANDPMARAVNGGTHEPEQASPSIEPPSRLHRDTAVPATPPSTKSTINLPTSIPESQGDPPHALPEASSSLYNPQDGAAGSNNIVDENDMRFGPYGMGAGSASHRRRQYANSSALTDYEADLTGKDRAKQKEAVRRFLADKIKDDWSWPWPRPVDRFEEATPNLSKEDSPETIIEEHWKERDEWISDASDSGGDTTSKVLKRAENHEPSTHKEDPFRFESPEVVDQTIKRSQIERKRRRKKRLVEEMAWNDGLRCFVQRRDAWTGARHVPRSASGRPVFSQIPNTQALNSDSPSSQDGGSSTAIEPEPSEVEEEWDTDVEVPVPPSLIPASNAMRQAINPTAYNTIYDKVILQQLSPSCPINLKDVTRSCVQGWKRDGEWPPNSSVPDSVAGRRRRRLSMASLFGLEKTKSKEEKEIVDREKAEKEAERSSGDGKAGSFRRSLQRILNLRKEKEKERENRRNSNGSPKDVVVATAV